MVASDKFTNNNNHDFPKLTELKIQSSGSSKITFKDAKKAKIEMKSQPYDSIT